MNQIAELIHNENVKIYKKSRTWILLGLLIIANSMVGLFLKMLFGGTDYMFWDFVENGTQLLVLIIFIGIIQGGDIVSSEFHNGTIKMLLIRPVSRAKILVAKYLSLCLFLVVFVCAHIIITGLVGLLFFSPTSNAVVNDPFFIISMLGSYVFGTIEIFIISTLAFTFSAVSRNSLFSILGPIFIYLVSNTLLTLLSYSNVQEGKYILFAHTDLSQHMYGQPMFEGVTLLFSLGMIALHMVLFFAVSYLVFTKKDVHV
ncbi:ABC transporter permease [Bacillus horti]|uniref:ABC-2 type transport system permease protein n=1 Tax=Caldalkalibacillus horti TaxID=77523 RepID=A0ABT9W4R9_9BACI|nr:ABC transporter permease [Bacillus horti]MDQ0168236.1 ABC-2 type transport system permease protein [Bacillus horti]